MGLSIEGYHVNHLLCSVLGKFGLRTFPFLELSKPGCVKVGSSLPSSGRNSKKFFLNGGARIKVILQKQNLLNNSFKTFLKFSLSMSVSKTTVKKIGHRACLGDVVGETYPIYACTGTNQRVISSVHGTFCCSSWKQGFLKYHFKKLDR